MKELVFEKDKCQSYKHFYEKICVDLDKESFIDWAGDYDNLLYRADLLDEFLWYNSQENILFKFVGYDREKIRNGKTYEDCQWQLIFKVIERFVGKFPNNKLEYID